MAEQQPTNPYTYRWDTSYALSALFVTLEKPLPENRHAISQIIDQTHHLVDREGTNPTIVVYVGYAQPVRINLAALMQRTYWSSKVAEVLLVGERHRTNEMTLLIAANAKRLPYSYQFFPTVDAARSYLRRYTPATTHR